MKLNYSKFNLKWILTGTLFLVTSLAPLTYAAERAVSASATLESLILAEAQITTREDLPIKTEPEGKLSDGWKYAISALVMFSFLALAIFVQLRAERKK